MNKKLSLMLMSLLLTITSCGTEKIKVARRTDGPKELYVILADDSDLISLEIKESFKRLGYKTVLSLEEGRRDVVKKTGNEKEILKDVSFSKNRYELNFAYKLNGERFTSMIATLRDKNENELLGTFKWEWNRLMPAPKVYDGIKMIDEKFLSKIFN